MKSSIWYPYAQMKTLSDIPEVVSAEGVTISLKDGRKLIDGISSWWAVIHGYKHPKLDKALQDQAAKFSHVMMCGLTHRPALDLSESLIKITPEHLKHVFFSDSGSVGCEVAIKMVIQYWINRGKPEKSKLLSLKKAYHGDTTGVMAVGDPDDGMHSLFKSILSQHYFLEAPSNNVNNDIKTLDSFFKKHHQNIAGFILEPLMQAAGGFNFYPAEYLTRARDLCDKYDVLLIFDEVATGFGRTGSLFALDQTKICPDILVLGKGLTGGYLGLSATLCCEEVFDAFYDDSPEKCFMHGPTFMGNPLACSVANASIDLCLEDGFLEKISIIESQLKNELFKAKSDCIKDIRVLGATGVIEVLDEKDLEGVQAFAMSKGVWLRPFSRYLYTMPPYIVSKEELSKVTSVMISFFEN
ncbi:adenosylmethionine--8-amino-7-oxononanoate transaminase [Candidatus Marinamargulisbacteria bacterium SCGC AAA071-K20]|nr:adenosylmethionine--8-amino-7-oxononanoate transaminase [Candidatus Marinamargulisbacteria bacterium SCGC AAA071-K20]